MKARGRKGATEGRPDPPKARQRKILRVSLDEEELAALEDFARDHRASSLAWMARGLIRTGLESCRIFGPFSLGDLQRENVKSRAAFFCGLEDLAQEAEQTLRTASRAANEGAERCRQWLEAEKIRRRVAPASPSGPKVVKGKFRPASE